MFEILQKWPECYRDTKWANAVGKMASIDWLDTELPQAFDLQKKMKLSFKSNKVESSKRREVCLYLNSTHIVLGLS